MSELHGRWRKKHPAPAGDPYLLQKAHREKQRAPGCIFVSYGSSDLEVARFIVSQLQQSGCLVWFDKEQLQPGENWEEELRKTVEERCGLFLSIISDHTAVKLRLHHSRTQAGGQTTREVRRQRHLLYTGAY